MPGQIRLQGEKKGHHNVGGSKCSVQKGIIKTKKARQSSVAEKLQGGFVSIDS